MPKTPSWDSATTSEPSREHSRQRPEDEDGGDRENAGTEGTTTPRERGEDHHRAPHADQQPPDPAAVFRRRSPVPQVQHDHAEDDPRGEGVEQPGGDRLQRPGGGQEQRAGDGRLSPGWGTRPRARSGWKPSAAPAAARPSPPRCQSTQRSAGRCGTPVGNSPISPIRGDDGRRWHAHCPGQHDDPGERRAVPPAAGRTASPRQTPSRNIAPAASSQAATRWPGPRNATDEPGDVERRRPDQHPADAGRVAGGQLDHDGRDQRASADDREHDADSPHKPQSDLHCGRRKGGQPHRRVRSTSPHLCGQHRVGRAHHRSTLAA